MVCNNYGSGIGIIYFNQIKEMNSEKFFSCIRHDIFGGRINQVQVNGLNAIMGKFAAGNYNDLRWLAYMLATTYHETAGTMQPISEIGKGKGKKYGQMIKKSGMPYIMPNCLYYGRGYAQLTWYENYLNMGRLIGIDLLNNPELALVPNIAADIMFEGMTNGHSNFGDFTGKSLEQYFNNKKEDWVNARRIINGLDCAEKIADYGKKFYTALKLI